MRIEIIVNHKASGAPMGVRGDGVLSMTSGVLSSADTFMSHFVGSGIPSTNYATMLFFINPETGRHTILHYQPQYSRFPEYNRYYDTRILYELTPKEFEKCQYSYAALNDKLSLMKDYDRRYYDANNIMNVDLPQKPDLNPDEYRICTTLFFALINQKQVFIHLGESDKLFGDKVRHSHKLRSLLRVFDSFPLEIRRYLSLGYAVENNSNGIKWLSPYLSIIAHCDSLSNWGLSGSDVISIDWTNDKPIFQDNIQLSSVQQQRIDICIPVIQGRYGTSVRTFKDFSSLFRTIPDEIDTIFRTDIMSVKSDDLSLLSKLFIAGNSVYRHHDASKYLLIASQFGKQTTIEESLIVKAYPDLLQDKEVQDSIVKRVKDIPNWTGLERVDNDYGSYEFVKRAILVKLTSSLVLMDECASKGSHPFSRKYQENVQEAISKRSNIEKLDRMEMPYYGLSVSSLNILSWKEFGELCDYLGLKRRKQINGLPYDINWKDELHESTYNYIKDRLTAKEKEFLRRKCVKEYYSRPSQRYLLGSNGLTDDELFELLNDKSLPLENKKDLIRIYQTRALRNNRKVDGRLADYYQLIAPVNRKVLSDLACCAVEYGRGFKEELLKDINAATRIGDDESFKNGCNELVKLQLGDIVEALNNRYKTIVMNSAPQTPQDIIRSIRRKDVDSISVVVKNELFANIYSGVDGFVEYYEELYGEKDIVRFLKKNNFYKSFSSFFQSKAEEYIKNVFSPDGELTIIDKFPYYDYPRATQLIVEQLPKQKKEELIAIYKVFEKHYIEKETNHGGLINHSIWEEALMKLMPKWKVMGLDISVFPKRSKMLTARAVNSIKANKILYASVGVALLSIITLMIIFVPRKTPQGSGPVLDTILDSSSIVADSLFIRITIGDDDTNAMWEGYTLDSLHPNVIFANTILDTLYVRTINCSIGIYCVQYKDSTRKVSDTTCVSFTKDNIHSVSLLLPIDSAYRSYLDSSIRVNEIIVDTLVFVCGKDTIRGNPKQSLLQQLVGDTKYSNDTVSSVIHGTDTIPFLFSDFIKKNTTPRYLHTTDYYLWVIQQLYFHEQSKNNKPQL